MKGGPWKGPSVSIGSTGCTIHGAVGPEASTEGGMVGVGVKMVRILEILSVRRQLEGTEVYI